MMGSSHYARIPASFCKMLGWEKGMVLNVYREGDVLMYKKGEE
jgi:antitoxin component of MazEF toxin-antitoxin module